jgi:hypothetical protein
MVNDCGEVSLRRPPWFSAEKQWLRLGVVPLVDYLDAVKVEEPAAGYPVRVPVAPAPPARLRRRGFLGLFLW